MVERKCGSSSSNTFGWMFEATVDDSTEEFWFEQEVAKAGAVDGDVGALDLLLAHGGRGLRGGLRLFVILVVQQFSLNVVLGHAAD